MEYNGLDFLEELLALRENEFYTTNPHIVDSLLENPYTKIPQNPCYEEFSSCPFGHQTLNGSTFTDYCTPFGDEAIVSSNNKVDSNFHEEYALMSIMDEHLEVQAANNACKTEPVLQSAQVPYFESGMCLERKSKAKKMAGQPSKNLMAERRRRKRLNDRLSMLRSVVSKISKMDRTSILGDTIDYVKELQEKIKNLQEEIEADTTDHHQLSVTSILKDNKPNEGLVRNSPKFDVERRNTDTRIEICCAGKPGLLLSTVTTLEALGLEIQQCVISCFNDFGMQASCSEDMDHSGNLSPEDIKQALFRNAGYGGRCL